MRALCLVVAVLLGSVACRASTYTVTSLTDASYGKEATLTRNRASTVPPAYEPFDDLSLQAMYWDDHTVRLRFTPSVSSSAMPYVVPDEVFSQSSRPASSVSKAQSPKYSVDLNEATGNVQVSTLLGKSLFRADDLRYGNQMLQFSTDVSASTFVTGWGERNYNYFLNHDLLQEAAGSGKKVSLNMWNTDQGTVWQGAMYGYHPFVILADPSNYMFSAIFLVQSHVANLELSKEKSRTDSDEAVNRLTFSFGGGLLDAFIITGSSMRDVVARYHKLIGTANVPPYWALGTHQSRWDYRTLSMLEDVVGNYSSHGIPLETIWNDNNPTMPSCSDYFVNTTLYPMPAYRNFIDKVLADEQHYVQITDPFIGISKTNPVYEQVFLSGLKQGVYINQTDNKRPLVATGWPGWTVFVDYSAKKGREWWSQQISDYRQRIPFSGQWVDEAEISCNVGCGTQCPKAWVDTPFPFNWWTGDWSTFQKKVCHDLGDCHPVDSPLNFPKFNPLMIGKHNQIWYPYNKTIDMTGRTALGSVYSTKAFYGMFAGRAAYDGFLNSTQKRPFILARASYAGAGKWMAHWTGDNNCVWGQRNGGLGASWQMVMAANLWGITMIGSDTCGFAGKTSQELCTRWYQSGAFYTFFRNHHTVDDNPQEPYRWDAAAQAVMKKAIFKRYELLPIFFSALMVSHYEGGPVLRHLSMEFPTDIATYVESVNFMVGSDILVIPVVTKGATNVTAYLPAGPWYSIWTLDHVSPGQEVKTFAAKVYEDPLPAFFRGGRVVALHTEARMTIKKTRAAGLNVLCALDANGLAEGQAWLDDGMDSMLPESIGSNNTGAGVLRLQYRCFGSHGQGRVEVTTLQEGPRPHKLPLSSAASVSILFPTKVPAPKMKSIFLNSERLMETEQTVAGSAWTVTLPLHLDGSTPFALEWYESDIEVPTTTTAPVPSADNAPPPSPSKSHHAPAIALGVVCFVLLVCIGILLRLWVRERAIRLDSALGKDDYRMAN